MTRPLVHLRERVRSERCSWGVINMENGREDRLRLGEEDEPGRRSGGRKRRTSGRQTAIRFSWYKFPQPLCFLYNASSFKYI